MQFLMTGLQRIRSTMYKSADLPTSCYIPYQIKENKEGTTCGQVFTPKSLKSVYPTGGPFKYQSIFLQALCFYFCVFEMYPDFAKLLANKLVSNIYITSAYVFQRGKNLLL